MGRVQVDVERIRWHGLDAPVSVFGTAIVVDDRQPTIDARIQRAISDGKLWLGSDALRKGLRNFQALRLATERAKFTIEADTRRYFLTVLASVGAFVDLRNPFAEAGVDQTQTDWYEDVLELTHP